MEVPKELLDRIDTESNRVVRISVDEPYKDELHREYVRGLKTAAGIIETIELNKAIARIKNLLEKEVDGIEDRVAIKKILDWVEENKP